jgi:hypothetical protein
LWCDETISSTPFTATLLGVFALWLAHGGWNW